MERTRQFDWQDPQVTAQAAMTSPGLAFLQAIVAGDLPIPPVGKLMNMTFTEVSYGRAVFEVTPQEYHYNPIGSVHGGVIAAILDSALGCAIHSTLEAGINYTTTQLHINYIRSITVKTGPVRAIGEIIHTGRRLSTAKGELIDQNGKLYAHATTTCMVITPR